MLIWYYDIWLQKYYQRRNNKSFFTHYGEGNNRYMHNDDEIEKSTTNSHGLYPNQFLMVDLKILKIFQVYAWCYYQLCQK